MSLTSLTVIGLIISFISPIVAVVLYQRNKKFVLELSEKNDNFIKQIHAERLSTEKMTHVIDAFLAMYNASKDTGISALIKAGITSLDNEHEINYVLAEIENCTGKHPLGRYQESIEHGGILKFFKKVDLPSLKINGGIEKIIEQLN